MVAINAGSGGELAEGEKSKMGQLVEKGEEAVSLGNETAALLPATI